jgi:hypothetical protein
MWLMDADRAEAAGQKFDSIMVDLDPVRQEMSQSLDDQVELDGSEGVRL